MEVTQRDMRDALSSFATGVTIVTTSETDADGNIKPVGMTASSFNSLSMDPPLVLWSVTKAALPAPFSGRPVTFQSIYFALIKLLFRTVLHNVGRTRVENLFELGEKQELLALQVNGGDVTLAGNHAYHDQDRHNRDRHNQDMHSFITLLQRVIGNTL